MEDQQQSQVDTKYAQNAFKETFSETPELNNLWQKASQGKTNSQFAPAREEFWKLVNNDNSQDAIKAREILDSAGYELQGGSKTPLLKMEWAMSDKDPKGTKQLSDRTLSIDHKMSQDEAKKQEDLEKILDSTNLSFLSARDNSFRGNSYDANDQPISK